jgi:hypothetical protein
MTRLFLALRLGRLGGWGSQQVARSNAAAAAAVLMRQRREREDVEAYLTQRRHAPARTGTNA